jgi:hypothetical protein
MINIYDYIYLIDIYCNYKKIILYKLFNLILNNNNNQSKNTPLQSNITIITI